MKELYCYLTCNDRASQEEYVNSNFKTNLEKLNLALGEMFEAFRQKDPEQAVKDKESWMKSHQQRQQERNRELEKIA